MAKLNRVTQKIFAGDAQPTETAVFGTMKTQNPVYTGDIAQLMSNPAFTQGWSSAVEESFAPFMEEMTGVQKVFSQQLAYILQQGIAEWDAGTTYYKGCFVKVYDENSNNLQGYFSLTDDNIGNFPWASPENWKYLFSSVQGIQTAANIRNTISSPGDTTTYPSTKAVWDLFSTINPDLYEKLANKVQDLNSPNATTYPSSQAVANESSRIMNIMSTLFPTGGMLLWHPNVAIPSGFLVCNGQAISRSTYANLFSVIGTTYGAGNGSTTFNIPNSSMRLLHDTMPVVGNGKSLTMIDGLGGYFGIYGAKEASRPQLQGGTDNCYVTLPADGGGRLTSSKILGVNTDPTNPSLIGAINYATAFVFPQIIKY